MTERRRLGLAILSSLLLHGAGLALLPGRDQAPAGNSRPALQVRLLPADTAAAVPEPAPVTAVTGLDRPAGGRRPAAAGTPEPASAPPSSAAPASSPETEPTRDSAGLPGKNREGPEPGRGPASPPGPQPSGQSGLPGGRPSDASEGEVFLARLDAAIQRQLVYPELARRRGVEGAVRVALTVAPDGGLLSREVSLSSGSALLDQAALRLLDSLFPFQAALPRELLLTVAVEYRLRD